MVRAYSDPLLISELQHTFSLQALKLLAKNPDLVSALLRFNAGSVIHRSTSFSSWAVALGVIIYRSVSYRLQFLENHFRQACVPCSIRMQEIALQFRTGNNVGNRALDQRDVLRFSDLAGEIRRGFGIASSTGFAPRALIRVSICSRLAMVCCWGM